MDHLKITVTNVGDPSGLCPVTGGVPIARGAAAKGCGFLLKNNKGSPVPCQARVIARWPDHSARWVLLDFQSRPAANETLSYTLTWGPAVSGPPPEAPVFARGGRNPLIKTGGLYIRSSKTAVLNIEALGSVLLAAVDRQDRDCPAEVETASVEIRGPMRSVLRLDGSFRTPAGDRLFGFRMYIHVFAGLSRILIEPMVLMDARTGVVQRFREIRLQIQPRHGVSEGVVGGGRGGSRLFQVDHQHYIVDGLDTSGARAPGWAEFTSEGRTAAVALRDFWQQWPKAIEIRPDCVAVGLFPKFEAGTFDHMFEPWYKHDYLFEGNCYRLRTGQVRRWQVWIDLDGNAESLANHANAPLVPAADPAQAVATGVWPRFLPAGTPATADYDKWIDAAFDGYVRAIDADGDYGAMNWGDWFGERVCNWGNEEYETPRQMMVQFARTANPKYLHLGTAAARHESEVDIIHFVNDDLKRYFIDEVCAAYTNRSITDNYPIRPGMNHAHCVGHVGGFHPVDKIKQLYIEIRGDVEGANPYLCLDPYNLAHVVPQGMAYYYFLTGDPWMRETLKRIGDNLAQVVEDRKLVFDGRQCAGRELGWPMLALGAIYEIGYEKRYLKAMKILAEDALTYQDPVTGAWGQALTAGFCNCPGEAHHGEPSMITAIRLNGLFRYHALSGDDRLLGCMKRGIDRLNESVWDEEQSGWRFTPCPASPFAGQPGVVLMALSSAARLFGDSEHRRILQKAWNAFFSRLRDGGPRGAFVGKAFGSSLYGSAETVSVLASE